MKNTGIVRRIDGLGRVVLPKEIRKTLKLLTGNLLQISIDGEKIVFEKYSPISSFDKTTSAVSENLYKVVGLPVIVTDKERVIKAFGKAKHLKDEKLTEAFIKIIEDKSSFIINVNDGGVVKKITANGDETAFLNQIIVPVITNEQEGAGSVIVLDDKPNATLGLKELNLCTLASKMLIADID